MAHAANVITATEVAHGRAFDHKSLVFTACRGVSMVSGGFLLGSGFSDGSLWGEILGTIVGVLVFAFNEVTVRRIEW